MQIKILSIILLLFGSGTSTAQHPSVTWTFLASPSGMQEFTIDIKASLRPGWHIYSQYLNEGGPIPTLITFDQSQDYIPFGKATEFGDQVRFYDSLYEMEITLYMQQVSFRQKIKIINAVKSIHGAIEYMTCNEYVCIPQREEFTVDLKTTTTEH